VRIQGRGGEEKGVRNALDHIKQGRKSARLRGVKEASSLRGRKSPHPAGAQEKSERSF
jgi:hypothetical protein